MQGRVQSGHVSAFKGPSFTEQISKQRNIADCRLQKGMQTGHMSAQFFFNIAKRRFPPVRFEAAALLSELGISGKEVQPFFSV